VDIFIIWLVISFVITAIVDIVNIEFLATYFEIKEWTIAHIIFLLLFLPSLLVTTILLILIELIMFAAVDLKSILNKKIFK
jgi:hypothetical protein